MAKDVEAFRVYKRCEPFHGCAQGVVPKLRQSSPTASLLGKPDYTYSVTYYGVADLYPY